MDKPFETFIQPEVWLIISIAYFFLDVVFSFNPLRRSQSAFDSTHLRSCSATSAIAILIRIRRNATQGAPLAGFVSYLFVSWAAANSILRLAVSLNYAVVFLSLLESGNINLFSEGVTKMLIPGTNLPAFAAIIVCIIFSLVIGYLLKVFAFLASVLWRDEWENLRLSECYH